MNRIKVAVADDHPLILEGYTAFFKKQRKFELLFACTNGKDLLEKLESPEMKPDLLLLDINMPVISGLEVLVKMRNSMPEVKVIVISSYNEDALIKELVIRGIRGFLLKDADYEEIVDAMEMVYEGQVYFNESISRRLIKNLVEESRINSVSLNKNFYCPLSEREKEIIQLISEEKSSKEIGEILHLSERTVENHRANILEKTKARNVAGILMFAFRNGIIK